MQFVYFDIGNTFHLSASEYTTAANNFGFSLDQIKPIHDEFESDMFLGKITVPQFWEICQQRLGIQNGANYDFLKSWVSDFQNIEVMHQLARDLSDKYSVGILSNHFLGMFEEILSQGKIPSLPYKSVVISCDVGSRKPELPIYEIAQSRANVPSSEILFIDDKPENLVVPQTLGWQTFLFDYRHQVESVTTLHSLLL